MMQLFLVSEDLGLTKAWENEFARYPAVGVIEADILSVAENCIVSPANGYGFMDGGIDRVYSEFFGLKPQEEVQKAIQRYCRNNPGFEYLPVGASVFVKTGHLKIPFMISAPTMIGPEAVGWENCFFAMAAILNCAWAHRDRVKKVYCPGLATGIGQVPFQHAAREMAAAYGKWIKKTQPVP